MNKQIWVHLTGIPCTVLLFCLHVCLGHKDCTGVDCPVLENCIEEVLEDGQCCATCLLRGCACEGYQYYDCISAGFKDGKVPEGRSYLVDFGSTECSCPKGGGKIGCHFIPCPEIPANCIDLSESGEGCPHCLRIGCTYRNQRYEAGHSFHMDPCQVCHCPNDGGDLMCSPIPNCEMVKEPRDTEDNRNELRIPKHEGPVDLPTRQHPKVPSNSLPLYTEDPSDFDEMEDYDYLPETASTSRPEGSPSSGSLKVQSSHDGLHEDPRKELRETLGTYDAGDSMDSPSTMSPTTTAHHEEHTTSKQDLARESPPSEPERAEGRTTQRIQTERQSLPSRTTTQVHHPHRERHGTHHRGTTRHSDTGLPSTVESKPTVSPVMKERETPRPSPTVVQEEEEEKEEEYLYSKPEKQGGVEVEVEGHQAFWTCDNKSSILVLTMVPPHTDSLGVSTETKAGLVTEDDPLPF
ncbi:hypothetical protein NFI96_001770 [Prochilodus magdalenae]|nr:hypothetical protein NFI96_001770 [Prochilodus magdalenae]